jgi:alpha-L-arabinofuranosidase
MNKGTNVLSLTMQKQPVAGQPGQDGLFASSVFDSTTGEVIIKVVNTSDAQQPVSIQLQGMKGERDVQTITLHSDNMVGENTLDRPEMIIPVAGSCTADAGKGATLITDDLPAKTFRIYKVKK